MLQRCLVLGPQGSGKSLLVKKLKAVAGEAAGERRAVLPTLPTVGAFVEELSLGRGRGCRLREYGGAMAPVWSSNFADCDLVVFVVDATDHTHISAATILLLELLGHRDLSGKPVLLVFNKLDRHCPVSLTEYKSVMRLGDILQHAPQSLSVVEGSCVQGTELVTLVFKWISDNIHL